MGLSCRPLLILVASAASAAALRRNEDALKVGSGPYPLDGSPLKNVVLLLQGVRPERRGYLEGLYDPIFQDVLTVEWIDRKDVNPTEKRIVLGRQVMRHHKPEELESRAMELRREKLESVRPGFVCLLDDGRFFYQSACLPTMMKYLLLRNPTTVGLMTCHADFWFLPSAILGRPGFRLDSIWQLGNGLTYPPWVVESLRNVTGPYCLTGEGILNDKQWHWRANKDQERAFDAVKKLHNDLGYDTTACAGWADAFYLPRNAWDRFLNISRAYFHNVIHEVAIPTTFRILNKHNAVPLELETRCWGSCCVYEAGVADLRSHVCGHKMDLRSESIRDAWSSLLREDTALLLRGGGAAPADPPQRPVTVGATAEV